jgi:beta-glucuronidase
MPELARRDWIAGAILWCYQDYKSRRTLRPGWDGGFVEHGLVDEYRQRKPSYYVWKGLNALAAIDAHWEGTTSTPPSRFTVTVTPNGVEDLPYYPLHNYRVAWQVSDEGGELIKHGEQPFADLAEPQVISGEIQQLAHAKVLKLHVTLLRPENTIAAEKSLEWKAGEAADAGGSTASKETPAR